MKKIPIVGLLVLLSASLAAPVTADPSNGKPTKPGKDQKPGSPAGFNLDGNNCLTYYIWTNVQPDGRPGPENYRRRVDDGKGYVCATKLSAY